MFYSTRPYLFTILLLISTCAISQDDTLKKEAMVNINIEEVHVSELALRIERIVPVNIGLDLKRIEELAPTDIGELVQRLPGATMRSYGGIGGLKTVSFRGLGASHTGVVINGIPANNVQTGMSNLAQIPVESIVGITNFNGSLTTGLPISAVEKGNVLVMNTYEDNIVRDSKYQMRSSLKYGSFGTKDIYLSSRYSKNNTCIAGYGKLRQSNGNYSYKLSNTESSFNRKNNAYQDVNFGLTVGRISKKDVYWKIGYKGKIIEQELPGAVILYNETSDETLATNDHIVYSTINKYWDKFGMYIYANANLNEVRYNDPTYLNSEGLIDNRYENQSAVAGSIFEHRFYRWLYRVGTEQMWSHLESNALNNVDRFLNYSNITFKYDTRYVIISALATAQIGKDVGESIRSFFQVSPVLNLYSKIRAKKDVYLLQSLTGKRSYRLPSFNEMYYGNIGNADLLPETSDQLSYNLIIDKYRNDKNLYWRYGLNPYVSIVNNKIVATPSKNLFVWTIQNVEKVIANGVEAEFRVSKEVRDTAGFNGYGGYSLRPKWEVSANYNFQYVIDVTDPNSPTYKNQIAYTPMNTFNLITSYYIKRLGFVLSNYFVSNRYVLNENNYQNLENGFLVTDLSVVFSHDLKGKKKTNKLSINCSVKNVFNVQYAFIRSFVMPGRNYLISLNYALD